MFVQIHVFVNRNDTTLATVHILYLRANRKLYIIYFLIFLDKYLVHQNIQNISLLPFLNLKNILKILKIVYFFGIHTAIYISH